MQIQLPKLKKVDNTPDNRKKILLLSDDLRFHSGIATMSKELIIGTAHEYKWVQLAAALNHPEHGKVLDISQSVNDEIGISNANVKLYCHTTYGNIQVLKEILHFEKPDVIMLFTDPRHWMWFWPFEHELKTKYKIGIVYLSVWDNLITPTYNKSFYGSCDALFAISRQTHEIHKSVLNHRGSEWIDLDVDNIEEI